MKELPDCGKRYIRPEGYSKLGECFWNCEEGFSKIVYIITLSFTSTKKLGYQEEIIYDGRIWFSC